MQGIGEIQEQTYEVNENIKDAIINEERGSKILHEAGLISGEIEPCLGPFNINEEKFSSHNKLIRVTAWFLRFMTNLKGGSIKKGFLCDDELWQPTKMWIEYIQRKYFHDVVIELQGKRSNSFKNLGVYKYDDGILKCRGRFQFSEKSSLILMPKHCHFTELIIVSAHRRMLHAGVAQTLADVRKEYWVLQGRSAVRKILRKCLICIHWEGGPFKTPPFAPLPNYVVSADHRKPFIYVGIYLGPIFVKDDACLKKNWICLFTCLNIRAVHLELVADMSAANFLLCIRRFIAKRGKPIMIISDNASQIKLGQTIIDKVWKTVSNDNEVQSYISNERINWKYTVDYVPWKGGYYERMVGLTKRSLGKTLGKSKASREQLLTLLHEIEAVINSLPLI